MFSEAEPNKRRKKVQNDEEVTFIDDLGDKWTEYLVYHHKFKEWMEFTSECEWQEDDNPDNAVSHSPYAGATAKLSAGRPTALIVICAISFRSPSV